MRRFLERRSISSRLVGMLVLSVVIPGVVLAWYGVQAVLQEDALYQASLRDRGQALRDQLYRDLGERRQALAASLDALVEAEGSEWVEATEAASERVAAAEPLVDDVLVLDAAGALRHPSHAAAWRLLPAEGATESRRYLDELLGEAQRLEIQEGDWLGAAGAYARALSRIQGARGQAIASLGRARCLLKAERFDEALEAYQQLSATSPDLLDANDIPVDLLGRYQAALALRSLQREQEAAVALVDLLEEILSRPWTFGGYGESALATRSIDQLERGGLLAQVPSERRPDLGASRLQVRSLHDRQSDQASILAALPTLSTPGGHSTAALRTPTFHPIAVGERTRLLLERPWQAEGEQRRVLLLLDEAGLQEELIALLESARRTHPNFRTSIFTTGAPPPPVEDATVQLDRSLAPWLPGSSLRVAQDSGLVARSHRQSRVLRLIMIGLLLGIILVGISVIARAVSREVEVARLKSDFVSSVSHELRTPLTTIRIMAEMLALEAVPSKDKQAEYHKNIVSEAERLTRLINNVLDFARIEEGRKKFEFGFGDIGDAVFEVERITGDYARKEGFTLETKVEEGLPPISFDRDAIIQALINLMSNAVKYSDEDKRIELGAATRRDSIVIWVEDHGPGIEAKEIPQLFEKFYRGGDHMTREAGGTGLGLSIVKHIVAAHGGTVDVDSQMGRGSRFEIILPLGGSAEGPGSEQRL